MIYPFPRNRKSQESRGLAWKAGERARGRERLLMTARTLRRSIVFAAVALSTVALSQDKGERKEAKDADLDSVKKITLGYRF